MPWILGFILGALAVLGLSSRRRKPFKRSAMDGWEDPSKKEWIVLPVGPGNDGNCVLLDQNPGEMRTQFGNTIFWIVYGSCPGGHTIEIKRPFSKDGEPYEIFEDGGTDLHGHIPPSETGAPLRLRGRLKHEVPVAKYTYEIWIDGQPARARDEPREDRLADDGDVYVCPVWPCDGHDDH